MKKYIIFLLALLISTPVFAESSNFTTYCPVAEKQGNITFTSITGINKLSEKIGQLIIKNSLKKETNGQFKVNLKSRSTGDLLNGKFKSLSIEGKDLELDGLYVSSLKSQTVCEYNSVKLNSDNIKFRENMVLNYEAKINNQALQKTLNENIAYNSLKNLDLSLTNSLIGTISIIKVSNISTNIANNKINFNIRLSSSFFNKTPSITIASDLKIKNGKLVFTNLKSNNTLIKTDKLISILERINLFTFNTIIADNDLSKISVDSLNITNNEIVVKGLVLLPKNVEENK